MRKLVNFGLSIREACTSASFAIYYQGWPAIEDNAEVHQLVEMFESVQLFVWRDGAGTVCNVVQNKDGSPPWAGEAGYKKEQAIAAGAYLTIELYPIIQRVQARIAERNFVEPLSAA